jgi:hypothetical protein
MKAKKASKNQGPYPEPKDTAIEMREVPPSYYAAAEVQNVPAPETMVRTQIYLTRKEHEFLQIEADRRGEPMSAFLRRLIDERMQLPETAWKRNPMLDETPDVEGWTGREDGALNHDHYIYGGAKKYERGTEGWQLQPPIKE